MLLGAGLTLYVAWLGGTVAGTLFGTVLGDPAAIGSMRPSLPWFLALLVPQLKGPAPKRAATLGTAIALALTPIAPPGVPIIAGAVACLLGGRR